MKRYIKGLVAGTMVAAMSTSVFAAIPNADFSTQKVTIDGTKVDLSKQPIITVVGEDGTKSTYLPMQQIFDRLSNVVIVDDVANSVDIYSHDSLLAPTKERISGTWETNQYDAKQIIKFTEDGKVSYLDQSSEGEIFCKGVYRIMPDHTIQLSFDFVKTDGTGHMLTGSDIVTMTFHYDLTPNMKTLIESGQNYPLYYAKSTFDLSTYEAGAVTPMPEFKGEKAATYDMLDGFWVGMNAGNTVKYNFDKKGNIAVRSTSPDGATAVTMHGTYYIKDGVLKVSYDYLAANKKAILLEGHDKVTEDLSVAFNKEGNMWAFEGEGMDSSVFQRDTTATAEQWRKYYEVVTNTSRPSYSLLQGNWISTDNEGASVKYSFTLDGRVSCLTTLPMQEPVFYSGSYTVLGNKVSIVLDKKVYEGVKTDLMGSQIIKMNFSANFNNGTSWSTMDLQPETFVEDKGDVSWVTEYAK